MAGLGGHVGSSNIEKTFYKMFFLLAIILVPIGISIIIYDYFTYDTYDAYLSVQENPGLSLTKLGIILIIFPPIIAFAQKIYLRTALEKEKNNIH